MKWYHLLFALLPRQPKPHRSLARMPCNSEIDRVLIDHFSLATTELSLSIFETVHALGHADLEAIESVRVLLQKGRAPYQFERARMLCMVALVHEAKQIATLLGGKVGARDVLSIPTAQLDRDPPLRGLLVGVGRYWKGDHYVARPEVTLVS